MKKDRPGTRPCTHGLKYGDVYCVVTVSARELRNSHGNMLANLVGAKCRQAERSLLAHIASKKRQS